MNSKRIGFACAYTPLPLIDAAGFTPYRILPVGESPDRAGSLLHDNLCPHVKRILDRALANDLPNLAGIVFMNSCDAMRRLSDAWREARPADEQMLLDMPLQADQQAVSYFAGELGRLAERLSRWGGSHAGEEDIVRSAERYNRVADRLAELSRMAARGRFPGGRAALQEIFNLSVTLPLNRWEEAVDSILAQTPASKEELEDLVPLFLFGNVMPDPRAFALLEECGASVAADDLCTGSRMHTTIDLSAGESLLESLARSILSRPRCARTLDCRSPGILATELAARASGNGARGVVAHVVKFCDPYLSRMPAIKQALRQAGLPLLVLEGDCTTRSLEQHRTRIEAFVEMLR